MLDDLSRRRFLGDAAAGIGGLALMANRFGVAFAEASDTSNSAAFCELRITETTNLLVAYATRLGSTAEIAEALAVDMRHHGYIVDVAPADKVADLGKYQAVVVGSAIRGGRWLPEAANFVSRNRESMQKLPTAFFAVHMMNTGMDEKSRKARAAYLDPVRKLVKPSTEAYFAGKLEANNLAARMLGKIAGLKFGDIRNWPLIHAWGNAVFCS